MRKKPAVIGPVSESRYRIAENEIARAPTTAVARAGGLLGAAEVREVVRLLPPPLRRR